MARITSKEKQIKQEAKNREIIVLYVLKHGNKSEAARKYFVSLSSVKRWCKRYDGSRVSLLERSHKPHRHPNQHTNAELRLIRKAYKTEYERYGWEGVYSKLLAGGKYHRSFEGMYHAAPRSWRSDEKAEEKGGVRTLSGAERAGGKGADRC